MKYQYVWENNSIAMVESVEAESEKQAMNKILDLMENFNATLRPNEKPRKAIGILKPIKDTRKKLDKQMQNDNLGANVPFV